MGLTVTDQQIIVIAFVLILLALFVVWKLVYDRRNIRKIISCLEMARETEDKKYQSSDDIAQATGLSEKKIRILCRKSKQVRRYLRKPDSWTLV